MINANRIVPVMKTDLLSLYGTILSIVNGSAVSVIEAADVEGNFTVATDNASGLCNQPVKSLNFTSAVSAASVKFVADPGYAGFSINGTAVVTLGDDVVADGATLYSAVLASGDVTIAKIF